VNGDKSFARASGQREHARFSPRASFPARREWRRPDNNAVSPRRRCVANEQWFGNGRIELEASGRFVTRPQFDRRGKFRERLRRGGFAGDRIVFDKEMAVAGKNDGTFNRLHEA